MDVGIEQARRTWDSDPTNREAYARLSSYVRKGRESFRPVRAKSEEVYNLGIIVRDHCSNPDVGHLPTEISVFLNYKMELGHESAYISMEKVKIYSPEALHAVGSHAVTRHTFRKVERLDGSVIRNTEDRSHKWRGQEIDPHFIDNWDKDVLELMLNLPYYVLDVLGFAHY